MGEVVIDRQQYLDKIKKIVEDYDIYIRIIETLLLTGKPIEDLGESSPNIIVETIVKETGMTQAEMEKCFKSDDSPINQQSQQEELTQYYRKILLTKEGMTPKDKENMTNIIQKLQQANQCTQENLQKLEKITYAKAYIKIGNVKFSRDRLIPKVIFTESPNEKGVYTYTENNTEIFKQLIDTGKAEYYMRVWNYLGECEKQNKLPLRSEHIEQTVKALPDIKGPNLEGQDMGGKLDLLGILLDLPLSGYINGTGQPQEKGVKGYLPTGEIHSLDSTPVYEFDKNYGKVGYIFDCIDWYNAYPCLYRIE